MAASRAHHSVLLGADLEAEESQRASTLTDRFILDLDSVDGLA